MAGLSSIPLLFLLYDLTNIIIFLHEIWDSLENYVFSSYKMIITKMVLSFSAEHHILF
jgi:hypothetical protein